MFEGEKKTLIQELTKTHICGSPSSSADLIFRKLIDCLEKLNWPLGRIINVKNELSGINDIFSIRAPNLFVSTSC